MDGVKVVSYRVQKEEDYGYFSDTHTETRYKIVDETTGKVLDDAQGYGYKTMQKAYAAWKWKKSGGYPESEKKAGIWLEKNPKIIDFFDGEELYRLKDPANDGVTKELCQQAIDDSGEALDFSADDLLKAWRKGLYVQKKRDGKKKRKRKKKK